MDYRKMYDSEYLASWDLDGDTTVTISNVVAGEVGGQKGEKKDKRPLVYFKGAKKPMVLNKTNGHTIAGMYGKDTDSWVGKTVTLFVGSCEVKGQAVDCLRIRPGVPKEKAAA